MNTAIRQYNQLPSYKLVLVIKDCKLLMETRPDYRDRLRNTITLIRDILIKRQRC